MLKPGIYFTTLLFTAVAIPELVFAILYLVTATTCNNYYLMLICAVMTLIHPAVVMGWSRLGADTERIMDFIRGLLTAELAICGLYVLMVIKNDECPQDWNELVYGMAIIYAVIYMCNVAAVVMHERDTRTPLLHSYGSLPPQRNIL